MEPLTVPAAVARRFLVRRHLLAPARSLPASLEGVRQAFARLGSVQFDPLAVAGRNHDLVLHARVRRYDPSWTNELLYARRELFETWNKGLSLLPTSELPWFRQTWDHFTEAHRDAAFVRHRETVEHVLARIREEGPLSSLDFERRPAVEWYWGPTNEIRAVLEALTEAGIVSLARREGNRRYFDLTERLYPAETLARRPALREQLLHKLLSRYRAGGLLGEGGQAELWNGIGRARPGPGDPPGSITRAELRAELVASGALVPLVVEGVRGKRYILGQEQPLLRTIQEEVEAHRPLDGATVSFLAPLDPFVWDRDLLRDLFGFDYVWEVYVPARRRRWGYYVLPILHGERLVGRIEPRIERAEGVVRIVGLWWQPGFAPRRVDGFVDAMRGALGAYLRFAGASRLEWGDRGIERRLFGSRPKPLDT